MPHTKQDPPTDFASRIPAMKAAESQRRGKGHLRLNWIERLEIG
jgi:hypothetical protein